MAVKMRPITSRTSSSVSSRGKNQIVISKQLAIPFQFFATPGILLLELAEH